VNKRTIVVPALEGKIGLNYTYDFCDWLLTLEIGYEAHLYFNALQSVDMGSEVIDLGPNPASVGVFARTFQRNISNFALAGPYLNVMIGF